MKIRKLALVLISTVMFAQGELKINSDSYFDYFFSSNHDASFNNIDGFALRRVYVTFNKSLNDKLSARVRFEAAGTYFKNPGEKHVPFVKDFYLKYKMSDSETFTAGIQGNIILKNYEKLYGLRYIEKSPNDLYRFNSSRDMGISYVNKFTDNITWSVLFGNGEGDKSEFNKGEILVSTLAYKDDGFITEVGGFINSDVKSNQVNVMQALAGYKTDDFKVMVSAHLHETIDDATEAVEQMKAVSFFGALNFESSMLFARVDLNTLGIAKSPSYYNFATDEEFTYFIAGYEMKPEKYLYITPNFSLISYKDSNIDSDFVARVTMRLKW